MNLRKSLATCFKMATRRVVPAGLWKNVCLLSVMTISSNTRWDSQLKCVYFQGRILYLQLIQILKKNRLTCIYWAVFSVRFEVGVSLLLAPTRAGKRGPKTPFPLVENVGIQPAICKKVPAGTQAGARSYWNHWLSGVHKHLALLGKEHCLWGQGFCLFNGSKIG